MPETPRQQEDRENLAAHASRMEQRIAAREAGRTGSDQVQATVPLTPAELEEIDQIASELGVTRQDVLRRAAEEYVNRHNR